MSTGLPAKINLEIVTPDSLLFSGEVDEVVVPGKEGALGILPGHAPLISELKIGVLSYRIGYSKTRLSCGWGFVEVLPDQVAVLAEIAEQPEDIDVERARKDKAHALELLRSKDPNTDYEAALELLQRAVTRLEVAAS